MTHDLLPRIEAFLKEAAMPPSVFGRAAAGAPRLVGDLRGGREPGRDLIRRMEHFMNKWRVERQAGRIAPLGARRTRAARMVKETAA